MKVRSNFVSNSSSSSFICDTELEADKVIDLIQRLLDVQNDSEGTDLSVNHIMDIYGSPHNIIIIEEYDNSIPYFIKSFIMSNLRGEEKREENV